MWISSPAENIEVVVIECQALFLLLHTQKWQQVILLVNCSMLVEALNIQQEPQRLVHVLNVYFVPAVLRINCSGISFAKIVMASKPVQWVGTI
jgi:hypothetical protein